MWYPSSETLGKDVNIFTHVLYWFYSSPPGFSFDTSDGDTFFIDENSETFNAP